MRPARIPSPLLPGVASIGGVLLGALLAAPAAAAGASLASSARTARAAEPGSAAGAAAGTGSAAVRRPPPWLFVRSAVAAAGWPSGLLWDGRLQARAPLHRAPSLVFKDTCIGAGGRFLATPAFVDAAGSFSFAPVDVFDVDVFAGGVFSWPGDAGRIPYDSLDGTLEATRERKKGTSVATSTAYLAIAPTLKLKLGPVVLFDAWNFAFLHVQKPSGVTAPYVYEAYRNLVVAWDDVAIEQQAALLVEALPGGERPLLRFGFTVRDRLAVQSHDRSTALGPLFMWKPGPKPVWPTIVVQVLPYVKDPDRVLGPPNVGVLLFWKGEHSLAADAASP
jgi:hypothetical protein